MEKEDKEGEETDMREGGDTYTADEGINTGRADRHGERDSYTKGKGKDIRGRWTQTQGDKEQTWRRGYRHRGERIDTGREDRERGCRQKGEWGH